MIPYRRANKQYVAMTEQEVWEFLSSKTKIFVGFPMADGYPHVSPVWFCIIDGKLYLRTHDYKVKTALAGAGKACCSIDEGELYRELKGVIVWGRSRVVRDRILIDQIERAMNMRYRRQQWKAAQMPAGWVRDRREEKRAFIEITPIRISSWDNSKV